MERSKESESLPANVYNYTYRVFGLDLRKIAGLMISVILSSVALHYSLFAFAAIIVAGSALSLARINQQNIAYYLAGKFSRFILNKKGIIEISYRLFPGDNGTILSNGTHLFQFIRITDANIPLPAQAEQERLAETLSRIIGEVDSDVDFLSLPASPVKNLYKVPETSDYAVDYNGLIDFAFDGCYYLETYIILKRRYRAETEARESAMLSEEASNIASLLPTAGLKCRIEKSKEEIMRILKEMG